MALIVSLLVGSIAFWAATSLKVAGDMAAAMAVIPTIITHFRWQQKGKASLLLPIGAFVVCFICLVLVQLAAARYTSSLMDGETFLLYPSLAMCFTISFSGPILLLFNRKEPSPAPAER